VGRGSIRKKEGHPKPYECRVELSRDPHSGKRRSVSRSFRTRREAQAYLAEALHEIERGVAVDRSTVTVGEWLEYWLHSVVGPAVEATSLERYTQQCRSHLIPALGSVPLQKLTAARVQATYAQWRNAGLGVPTIRTCHTRLSSALRAAVRLGVLSRNVAQSVTPPRPSLRRQMRVWERDQAKAFLATAAVHGRLGPFWLLLLATGLRRGEALGLRWRDVDEGAGALRVRQTVQRLRGTSRLKDGAKTPGSARTVVAPPEVFAALRDWRARQLEHRLQLGAAYVDRDLVFAGALGQHLCVNTPGRELARLIRLIPPPGVPAIRLHDLRHTYATLTLADGMDLKTVSENLGHKDPALTQRLYQHVLPAQRADLAGRVSRILFG
jgi:integrase